MARHVYNTLDEFGLKDKLFCITTDSASNNYKMVKELAALLLEKDNIDWNSETCHIPCLAHTINIVVQKFLTNLALGEDNEADNDVDNYSDDDDEDEIDRVSESPTADELASISSLCSVINKIRAIAKSIRGSTQKWERFQKACDSYKMKSMTIPLDITVRWNSTFRMLHQAVYLRRPIHRYVDDLRATHLRLSDDEWQQAELLLMFLLPFQRCSKRFECNSSQTEIDYIFFAYDTMWNHIDDFKDKLNSEDGIGALSCAKYMLKAITKMEVVLKKYYSKTALPTVYGDGMILNPRCKLVLFQGESWGEEDSEEYSQGCRRRFVSEYEGSATMSSAASSSATSTTASPYPHVVLTKQSRQIAFTADPEYQAALADRSSKRRKNDYDRYIEVPNDPDIPSGLCWWGENHRLYPELALMVRDVLAIPASGCAVERQFSISGRMTIWQRNRLSPKVISDSMIYKGALAKTRCPLRAELKNVDDIDVLPVEEKEGHVPEEWTQNWWLANIALTSISADIIKVYGGIDDDEEEEEDQEEEEDIYG